MADKIGIDFHGVISAAPGIFAVFCHEIRKLGIKVYIISGGPKKDIVRYLAEHQVEYDEVWAILDFYERQGKVEYFSDGSFKVDTALWNKAKGEYCEREGIRFHIDDSNVYGRYFATPYCQYELKGDVCKIGNKFKVDFNEPVRAAEVVAAFIQG